MTASPCILLCGPSRKAVSGVSTHLNQLFRSTLATDYTLYQYQVGSEGRNETRLQKALRFLTSPFVLMTTIIRVDAKIVHLNTSMDAKAFWRDFVYLVIARLLRRKIIYQVHGGELPDRFMNNSRMGSALLRWGLDIPDIIVVLANAEQQAYGQFLGHDRVELVPNAIDLDDFAGLGEKSYAGNGLRLGYIGRLDANKGLKEAVGALATLRRRGVGNLHFTIAGSGAYEREIRELVQTNELEESVQFLGPVFGEDKVRFFRDIDMFVFPSYSEGLPYAVLEALAAGVPVVATPVGGIPDVVQEGVHGVFVNARDTEGLACAIEGLASDRVRLRAMSHAAAERARENFGVERLAAQFDRIYQRLIA